MKSNYKKLGEFIRQVDERNVNNSISRLLGVSIEKCFIESIANTIGTDMTSYKIVNKRQFAYGPVTSRNGDKVSIALLEEENCIVSSSYTVFEVIDEQRLLPEYLNLWFKRSEFDRYARFHSHGSAREIFDWEEMCNVELPVPPIEEQQKIVDAYNAIERRIAIKRQINDNLLSQAINDYSHFVDMHDTLYGTIGDYCDIKSGYAFKSEWWTDEGYKVIKIANIIDNSIDLDHCDCVSDENARKSELFYVHSGDVLIAMTGATTGKIGIVPYCNDKVTVNQRVGKFFLGNEPLNKLPFLVCTLLSKSVLAQLRPDGTAGSAQDNLSADDIKNIEICFPPLSDIAEFNNAHKPHFIEIIQNFAEIRSLMLLLTTLLQTISSR